jgi:hypothetical protein
MPNKSHDWVRYALHRLATNTSADPVNDSLSTDIVDVVGCQQVEANGCVMVKILDALSTRQLKPRTHEAN